MPLPLQPAVFDHLHSLSRSTTVGVHAFLRSQRTISPSSAYRLRRSLGDKLLVIPNIQVEALGLRHAHVFLSGSAHDCGFAVEAAVVTRNFCNEELYLHCLVPVAHAEAFAQQLSDARIFWSSSGWQQFLTNAEELLLPIAVTVVESDIVRRCPFIIPAMMELWSYPNSFPATWQRIQHRLGPRLKSYLPRTKVLRVNGKTHLAQAFRALQEEGLVRQHLVRYHPLLASSIEVFAVARFDRAALTSILEELRVVLHAVESYPTSEGYFVRLLGPYQLLDAIFSLPAPIREYFSNIRFHAKRYPTPQVRYTYEAHDGVSA